MQLTPKPEATGPNYDKSLPFLEHPHTEGEGRAAVTLRCPYDVRTKYALAGISEDLCIQKKKGKTQYIHYDCSKVKFQNTTWGTVQATLTYSEGSDNRCREK